MKKRYIPLVVLLLVAVGYWLFANTIIKSILEDQLSQSYGAEVNIGSFNHSLFPTTVTIEDIQLTNPTAPMRNQVVVGKAFGDVALMPLLSKEVIVNKLQVLDVEFDQPRSSEGKVLRQPTQSLTFDEIKQKAKEAIPTVDELIERNPLKTTAAVAQAKQTYETYSEELKTSYQALPDKSRIEEYKTQVEALKEMDFKNPQALVEAQSKLKTLKEQISADRALITDFTDNAKNARTALSDSLQQLKAAPKQDYQLMKGIIAGDEAAMQQVTQLVFGDKAAEYTQYLMSAVQIVLPLIQGEPQTDDTPATELPAILVKEAEVAVKYKDETIGSVWKNITNTHPVFGEPTTFTISAAGELLKQFESSGQFWIDEKGVDASQQWSLAGVNLANVPMVNSEKLSAALEKALVTTSGQFSINDNLLNGSGDIDLASLVIEAAGTNKLTTAIANALNQLKTLDMKLNLSGTLSNPDFAISSDLDNKLAQAAISELTASQQDKLDEVMLRLNGMVGGVQTETQGQLVNVESMLSAAQGDSSQLESLLKTQLNSVIDQQKNKLFDKLKSKLGQ
ncbi:TIGR03545 family protein [Alteromonas confluentis]|uniref:TIGR03545 family protein n=1 Tax=Alteromonas confluentis TaxID=1656094 RepID=A0A1E7ZB18_9ALTE|nr:TIGR03545 family protein [Alteromonas confluentis]OFC70716.1 TIGR03545 family protein [Alteromonas confluentis]